jgi:hypothetical protein
MSPIAGSRRKRAAIPGFLRSGLAALLSGDDQVQP